MTVPIRQARPDEVEPLTALINAAYVVEKFFIDGDRASPDLVRRMMAKGAFLALEDGDTLVACVYVEIKGERGYFGLLSVDPSAQGRTLGRTMVVAAEDHARAAGCVAMDIRVVNLRSELPPFYHRLGYRETGTEPVSESRATQPFHFILMSKAL